MRDIDIGISRINDRIELEYRSQAALHGIDLPESKEAGQTDSVPSIQKLSPEQRERMSKHLKDAQERLKQRAKGV